MTGVAYSVVGRWVDNVFWLVVGGFGGWHAHKKRLAGATWKSMLSEAVILIAVVVIFYAVTYLVGGNGF